VGAIAGAGGTLGLLAGGVVIQALSGRWVFFINVPIGAAVLALAPRIVPESRAIRSRGATWLPVCGEVRYLLCVSIVGIDRMPYGCDRRKLECEHLFEARSIPHTILGGDTVSRAGRRLPRESRALAGCAPRREREGACGGGGGGGRSALRRCAGSSAAGACT
jgi:MFS family permease